VKKRIIVSVSNDIATDQRVRKQCQELHEAGYEVVLYGRKLPESLPVERPYAVIRMRLPFKRGVFFYASLNTWLFIKLLFLRADFYWANDLDTLPANGLVARLKGKPLIYDSHEFFTEVPEIQGRPVVKSIWSFFERAFISKAVMVITVNDSIGKLLEQAYGLTEVLTVRNLPDRKADFKPASKSDLKVKDDQHLLILQGSGINVDRGGEELVLAMQYVENSVLFFVGGGDAIPLLKRLTDEYDLQSKIRFYPKMPYDEMMEYTAAADLGFTLDKDTNLNYRYSLPNKVFDYVAAGTPVMATKLPEVARFVNENGIGLVLNSLEPEEMAREINRLLNDPVRRNEMKKRASELARTLDWKTEFSKVLRTISRLSR